MEVQKQKNLLQDLQYTSRDLLERVEALEKKLQTLDSFVRMELGKAHDKIEKLE
jgi:hypothetical protein